MLQVITGMYFRDVKLNETGHRRTFYTNVNFLNRDHIDFLIGHLTPATTWDDIGTVLAHFTERLEAVRPDGQDDFMVSTGGAAIADDLAVVLSFTLSATFTTVHEKADRLIRPPPHRRHPTVPLRQIFFRAPSRRA